jgi:hypothetical protein
VSAIVFLTAVVLLTCVTLAAHAADRPGVGVLTALGNVTSILLVVVSMPTTIQPNAALAFYASLVLSALFLGAIMTGWMLYRPTAQHNALVVAAAQPEIETDVMQPAQVPDLVTALGQRFDRQVARHRRPVSV